MTFTEIIIDYYKTRGLLKPTFDDAMKFVLTEIGEVYELDLARKGYKRNNPENKPVFTQKALGRELGDIILMAQVAGMLEGCDPLSELIEKMSEKAGKKYEMRGVNL